MTFTLANLSEYRAVLLATQVRVSNPTIQWENRGILVQGDWLGTERRSTEAECHPGLLTPCLSPRNGDWSTGHCLLRGTGGQPQDTEHRVTMGLRPLWGQRNFKPGEFWIRLRTRSRGWERNSNQWKKVNSRESFIIRMDQSCDLEERIKEKNLSRSGKRESSTPSLFFFLPQPFFWERNGERVEGGVGQIHSVWPEDWGQAPRAKSRNGEQVSGNGIHICSQWAHLLMRYWPVWVLFCYITVLVRLDDYNRIS